MRRIPGKTLVHAGSNVNQCERTNALVENRLRKKRRVDSGKRHSFSKYPAVDVVDPASACPGRLVASFTMTCVCRCANSVLTKSKETLAERGWIGRRPFLPLSDGMKARSAH